MNTVDEYWKECISVGAEECNLILTDEQLHALAESAMHGHEYYGMAFYAPPSSDRLNDIDRAWKLKLKTLQDEFDRYRNNAETAIKKALHQYDDSLVSIEKDGEVFRHDGRVERIL